MQTSVLVRFDAKQTDKGLQLMSPKGFDLSLEPKGDKVVYWPRHLYMPRMFYLWALDNHGKPDTWAIADGLKQTVSFYLPSDGWAVYELAHPEGAGHHYNLTDSGMGA